MSQVQRPLISLIVLFSGAVTVDQIGDPSLPAWVFLYAATAMAFIGSRGSARRARPQVLSIAVLVPYLIIRTLVGIGGDIYLVATEVVFVTLTSILTQRVGRGLRGLDDALASVAFGENPALPLDGPQAGNEILTEMARSRRHERPLSVTVLAPDPATFDVAVEHSSEEVQRTIRARYVRGKLGRLIAGQLRRSDVLFEDARTGRYLVLSPETGDDGAALLVERVQRAAGSAGLKLESGSASFPDQAVSFEQLVDVAERRLAGDTALPPKLRAVSGAPGGEA
jgi:hypothetical protein